MASRPWGFVAALKVSAAPKMGPIGAPFWGPRPKFRDPRPKWAQGLAEHVRYTCTIHVSDLMAQLRHGGTHPGCLFQTEKPHRIIDLALVAPPWIALCPVRGESQE